MSAKAPAGTFLGHPTGLFLLFATEMWERFSYYGMRALLVLTLVAGTKAANPGFGWSHAEALNFYGTYTALVYFTPVIGGWLADNYLGQRLSVIIGGLVMAVGQFTLAYSVPGNMNLFYVGLLLLIVGNGFFKANISTMVGNLYQDGDSRRDGAFSIFYMGINLGAFLAPLVCSTLGESSSWGWKYGYIAAGCGMLVSVVVQVAFAKKFLGDIGLKPSKQTDRAAVEQVALDKAVGAGEATQVDVSWIRRIPFVGKLVAFVVGDQPFTKEEKDRLSVILVLFVFIVLFWAAFEQAGGLMNIYAQEKTNRFVTSAYEMPAGYFQSANPFFIIILAPLFAAMWGWLGSHGRNPPTPKKMILGLLLTALGFLFMVGAVFEQKAHGKASMSWLILAYFFHTMGELCISPVGLSMVTKLSPVRLASVMMGVWFLINFVANKLQGYVGAQADKLGELAIFAGIAIVLAIFAVILWVVSGRLVAWMHGAEDIKTQPTEKMVADHLETSEA